MPGPLTPRQKQVLDFITQIIKIRGISPHLAEIAEGLDLHSLSNIHRIIIDLEKKGYLLRRSSTEKISLPKNNITGNRIALNSNEMRVYDCVLSSIGVSGVSPSLREIAKKLEPTSIGNIHKNLKSLEEKGYLVLNPGQAYGISLVESDKSSQYPVFHEIVPCGADHFLSSGKEGTAWKLSMQLPILIPDFVEADASSVFGVVLGDSRGLLPFKDGDNLIFHSQLKPKPGDVVALVYEDRVIVRYYHPLTTQEGKTLFSCNGSLADTRKKKSNYIAEDLYIKNADYKILGVAVSAIVRSIGSRKSSIKSWRSIEHED